MAKRLPPVVLLLAVWAGPVVAPANEQGDQGFAPAETQVFSPERYQGPGATDFDSHIYRETTYLDVEGARLTIQNGYPKGGGAIDLGPEGPIVGHALFFTRVINETERPLSFSMSTSPEPVMVPFEPGSRFRLFLLPDAMRRDQVGLMSYGVTGLAQFLRGHLQTGSSLSFSLAPGQERLFNVALLTEAGTRTVRRTALVVDGERLVYELTIDDLPPLNVPLGHILPNRRGDPEQPSSP